MIGNNENDKEMVNDFDRIDMFENISDGKLTWIYGKLKLLYNIQILNNESSVPQKFDMTQKKRKVRKESNDFSML